MAAIESHLRSDARDMDNRRSLSDLIAGTGLPADLQTELHSIRRYRNKWVYVLESAEESELLQNSLAHEKELEQIAARAIRALRETTYLDQCL